MSLTTLVPILHLGFQLFSFRSGQTAIVRKPARTDFNNMVDVDRDRGLSLLSSFIESV